YELTLDTNATVGLINNGTVHSEWAFAVLPDQPPTIRFTREPSSAVNGTMELTYEIRDDYGAASAQAKVEQVQPPAKDARPLFE
ncbi:DUF4175 domain-containing protein, partial [Campylobacter coli]|nr:DUF4175 domain-containing protein [Campylobacter coli]